MCLVALTLDLIQNIVVSTSGGFILGSIAWPMNTTHQLSNALSCHDHAQNLMVVKMHDLVVGMFTK